MKYDKILAVLNKHLQDTNSDKEYHVRPKFKFNLGERVCSVSIQASEFAYSSPWKSNQDYYYEVELDVHDNTIFITDIKDGEWISIDPEAWEHIKENIDQQIADGCLDDRDEDYER